MAYFVETIASSTVGKKVSRSFGIPESLGAKQYILDEHGSIENLKAKAKHGQDFTAQADLACLYECGMPELSIEKDSDKAIYWFETALKNDTYDITHSLSKLGALYSQKDAVVYQRRGIELFLKAADFGDRFAELNLAEAYRCGVEGVFNEDLEEAFLWYRRAADEGHHDVKHLSIFMSGRRQLCIDVKLKALKKLYELYLRGDCPEGEPQTIKAQYYIKKAAELGDPEAQKDLGLMYLIGETGIPKDFDKAKRWLQKAAGNGNCQAQQALKELSQKNVLVPFEDEEHGDQKIADLKSTIKQHVDIRKMELKDQELHSFVIKDPQFFNENTFRQYPDSPTAQRYLKAYLLVLEGLQKLIGSNFTDPEGITLLARGVLYENTITQPFVSIINDNRDSLKTLILSQQRKNPHFFEGSVVLIYKVMPIVAKLSAESSKLDFRKDMALHNLIHLIKKAEPDKPPKEDPYNYEDDYSSWLHELYYFLGSLSIISECFRDGAVAFQNALQCCPNYYEAKMGLAYCLMHMGYQDDRTELSPNEKLSKSFELPESQRIPKGDFLTWAKEQKMEKAKELFLEYLDEAPECAKKCPNCHYHLACLYLSQGDIQESIKWKEKGEDLEEQRLPFMGPVNVGTKKLLSCLDVLPVQKMKNEKVLKNKKKCNNKICKKEGDDVTKRCPCNKAAYCGSECQNVDWKEHKKTCEWKKQKSKQKKDI